MQNQRPEIRSTEESSGKKNEWLTGFIQSKGQKAAIDVK